MATTTRKTSEPVKKAAGVTRGKGKATTQQEGEVKAPAAKKPAAPQTPSAKKPAKAKAPAAEKGASRTVAPPEAEQAPAMTVLTPEQRRLYVEVAAYYIAERRGFQGGSEMDDWVQAEAEIDRLLREGILKP
ncbi:MAG: DUF2934 domain-containing protein [Rhodocyclaceae bacterium]|jgi:hypothetical protein|nr:DUF2934 domain-containing protein [Rhodocyclaceae bacterium]